MRILRVFRFEQFFWEILIKKEDGIEKIGGAANPRGGFVLNIFLVILIKRGWNRERK